MELNEQANTMTETTAAGGGEAFDFAYEPETGGEGAAEETAGAAETGGGEALAGEEGRTQEAEPEEGAVGQAGQAAEPYLTIRYNHEERGLTREEAAALAQKGLHYDTVHQELQRLKDRGAENVVDVVEKFARQNGMSAQDYTKFLGEQYEAARIRRLTERGVPEEVARELAQQQRDAELSQRELERLRGDNTRMENERKAQREWMTFFEAHPEVKTYGDLPKEVRDAIAAGTPAEQAYTRHRMAEMQRELEGYRQQERNRQASPGSARSTAPAGEEERDGFLRALLGEL